MPALRAQTERVARGSDVRVDFEADDLPPLPAAVEVAAFRAVVEAVNNTVRHGHADHCWIRLQLPSPAEFVVDVSDDGRSGYDWTPGVGLIGMRERAEELGGTFTAGPTAAGGARVVMRLPLVDAAP